MSYHHIESPPRARIAWIAVAAASAVLVAIAATAGWAASRPAHVLVDGVGRDVDSGATISSLGPAVFKAPPGNLLAIDGRFARLGGGEPARVLRNGKPATPNERLHNGDILVSRPGADLRESLETTRVDIPPPVVYLGEGSLMEERVAGVPGLRTVTRGVASGIEVSSTVLRAPTETIVQRMRPGAGAKVVALTFDDGPWPRYTKKVLKVLEDEQVRATFFMLGNRVKRQPELARLVVSKGHQVAGHSLSHRNFAKEKSKEIKRQIRGGRNAIRQHTGVDSPYLRPPYGAMDGTAWKIARAEKARIVMWDVDPKDWKKGRKASKIVKVAVANAEPGAIILLHDGGGKRTQTIKALPKIIKKLKAKGYSFVTVDELYAMKKAKK